jgi:hypothetical protein
MAQLGKLSGTVTDAAGNAASGATVEVRQQGATVSGAQAGPTYTVHDIGAAAVGLQVKVNATGTVTRNISGVTASSITTSGPGLGSLNNGDRITITSTLPTLYGDNRGDATKANPLTADASGYWECWVPILPYDLKQTYSGSSVLKLDVVPEGMEKVQSNMFTTVVGTAVWHHAALRTITSGMLERIDNPDGTSKRSLDFAGNESLAGNETVAGNLSVGGTGTITGLLTATGGETVASSFTYSGAAGSYSLTAGSIETQDLAANAVTKTYVGTGTADDAVATGAYPTFGDVTNANTGAITLASTDELTLVAHTSLIKTPALLATYWMAIRDGTTVIAEAIHSDGGAGANEYLHFCVTARLTGIAATKTYKVSVGGTQAGTVQNATTPQRATTIVAIQHKK